MPPSPPSTDRVRGASAGATAPTVRSAARRPPAGRPLPGALRPAWAEIDLGALAFNLATVRRALRSGAGGPGVLAVIKADAYGHGAPVIGRALEQAGVDHLGVALLEEGTEVRRAGVETPILVLGVAQPEQLPYFRRFRLTPVLSGLDQVALWREWLAGRGGYVQPVHLQVDTGMSRLGIGEHELGEALAAIRGSPHLELVGFLSHFAEADTPESPKSAEQERRFRRALGALSAEERSRALVHFANSAGALHRPDSRYDLVRLGLTLYGYDPAGVFEGLRPVMSVKTRTVLVREIEAGTRVSYGGLWEARRPTRIGILPVGYADGYAWRLTGSAEALVRGRRVPVVGAVSMDMIFVDLTDLPGSGERGGAVGTGEEVVLLGSQGDERITAVELAEKVGTIPYELLCLLGLRLARRYVGGGGARTLVRHRFEGRVP